MKEINLEEILFNSKFKDLTNIEKDKIREGLISYTHEEILIAMKEACKQALELAAEIPPTKELEWEEYWDGSKGIKQISTTYKEEILEIIYFIE